MNKANNHKTLYYKECIEKEDFALAECKCQHFIPGRKNIMYFIILKCIRKYMLCFKTSSQMHPEKKCAIFGILTKLDARSPCGILENLTDWNLYTWIENITINGQMVYITIQVYTFVIFTFDWTNLKRQVTKGKIVNISVRDNKCESERFQVMKIVLCTML